MKRESADMAKKKQKQISKIQIEEIVLVVLVVVIAAVAYSAQSSAKANYNLDTEFNTTYMSIVTPSGASLGTYGVYLAANLSQQLQGYMNQSSLGDCKNKLPCIGMLFEFENYTNLCFWMKNTPLPLKQVWINQNYTVTHIYYGSPNSTAIECYPGQYVLETSDNQAIMVGDRIGIGLTLP